MPEPTKIDFHHRRVSRLSEYTELVAMLVPGNRNQQYAAACIFLERKSADAIVPNLAYLEREYTMSRYILQRTRAKLARLGWIEHVSYLNSRYGGQHGWKLSSRFETGLGQLAGKCTLVRSKGGSRRKDEALLVFMEAGRT